MIAERTSQIPSYIYRKSRGADSPEVVKKKRKLQNASTQDGTRLMDDLTPDDDVDESVIGTQAIGQEKPKDHKTLPSNDLSFVRTMNLEEVNNHIKKCLEMSSENKITPKNAFALQLIDCMNVLLQKEDFSVMACTLDAGQKIYANRVDSLHHQVIKLAEEVINHRKIKKIDKEDGEEGDEPPKKETRKANKKNILASSESLRRTLKSKDPKEKYIKIDGLPGAIISSVRNDPNDLSFTLQNNNQFWNDWENYKPVTAYGSVTIPHCEIDRDVKETRINQKNVQLPPIQEDMNIADGLIASVDELFDEVVADDINLSSLSLETEDDKEQIKSLEDEVDVVSNAIKRLNEGANDKVDLCDVASRFETMKLIFNQVSDYHYLNMEKAYYWAGPEFWKRPKTLSTACSENKKISRKNKDPAVISYSGPVADERIRKILKKGATLKKNTIMGWKMKNVTYAKDLKIGVEPFLDLYSMSNYFEPLESPQENEEDTNEDELESNCNNNDIFEDISNDSSGSQDPLNSSFYENAPEVSSPEYRDPLNSAFYDAGLSHKPEVSDTGKILKVRFSPPNNCDTSLVAAPKTVTYQPIKYKTKPNRVDMQHLKQTMWGLINEGKNKNEQDKKDGSCSDIEHSAEIKFSDVLKQLPPRLEKRTAEDLFPGMSLLALLTLAGENNLSLKSTDNFSDVSIAFEKLN